MWHFIKENHKNIQMMLAGIIALLCHYHFFLPLPMAIVVFILLMIYPHVFPHGYDDYYVLSHGHNLKQIERSYLRRRRQYPWLDLHLAFACCADNRRKIELLDTLYEHCPENLDYQLLRTTLDDYGDDEDWVIELIEQHDGSKFSPRVYLCGLVAYYRDEEAFAWARFDNLRNQLAYLLYKRDCLEQGTVWSVDIYDVLSKRVLEDHYLRGFERYVAVKNHAFWRSQFQNIQYNHGQE